MEATSIRPGYELWRPNREKSESKATKVLVAIVLIASAALLLIMHEKRTYVRESPRSGGRRPP